MKRLKVRELADRWNIEPRQVFDILASSLLPYDLPQGPNDILTIRGEDVANYERLHGKRPFKRKPAKHERQS